MISRGEDSDQTLNSRSPFNPDTLAQFTQFLKLISKNDQPETHLQPPETLKNYSAKRDLLRGKDMPSIEDAALRYEAARTQILKPTGDGIEAELAARNTKTNPDAISHHKTPKPPVGYNSGSGVSSRARSLSAVDRTKLRCAYCNKSGHLKSDCFKLHGEPDWFKELKRRRQQKKLTMASTVGCTTGHSAHHTNTPKFEFTATGMVNTDDALSSGANVPCSVVKRASGSFSNSSGPEFIQWDVKVDKSERAGDMGNNSLQPEAQSGATHTMTNGLYYIDNLSPTGSALHSKSITTGLLWHRRLEMFRITSSSGGGTGGIVAKDALGNDVVAEEWLKNHVPGDRTFTQGLKGDPTYLVVENDRTLATYGINAVCMHLGCVVPWNAAENKFMCPYHGSQYNNQGRVVRGPAPLICSLALAHADIDDGKVVFVPWVETDFRTGENPWWA
ncbi:hypothetical protein CASFOL_031428 [Castilleja foliolosa]|uniref:plastoquinol--plastocyanin reductase n=2 Tax=Magnoliopsida TaxID=3398 RepID=A0ABD3C7G0_9LAMI